VRACVRACVRANVRACLPACVSRPAVTHVAEGGRRGWVGAEGEEEEGRDITKILSFLAPSPASPLALPDYGEASCPRRSTITLALALASLLRRAISILLLREESRETAQSAELPTAARQRER
jgi:hypothetical protein